MNAYEVLHKQLRVRMNELADTLASGACTSYEEYKRLCGVIEGLAYAERDLLDLKEAMEQNDE
jgi:hypothetical protein